MTRVLPGAARIGVLGGGQLGQMLCVEAARLGYRTAVLDPSPDAPAARVAGLHVRAAVDDPEAAAQLAQACDVVTLEWELIAERVLERVEEVRPLHPGSRVLRVIQDRWVQREFLARHGFPQARHGLAGRVEDLPAPCLVKRRRAGYDGKGQARWDGPASAAAVAPLLEAPCLWEELVPFARELSVILARGADGAMAAFPIAENVHRRGILHTTRAPAAVSDRVRQAAEDLGRAVAEALDHVGVLAVELFLLADGSLLVNEIAPRVHNSGHFTWGACRTSQFEQHIRAVCGLPLGDGGPLSPAVMVNLPGDLWASGEPRWEAALRLPGARLHLYGKSQASPGRKMGHVLLLGQDTDALLRQAEDLLEALPCSRS
ncbi:MAG: 5-(carboxyamino)imidazole ribonucleotide synthase [Elusimicrobia bacterium]|nr:5-(carboxyamino)imidazole ribonucleotide synthase [Elusimicrobiota bacterium]